VVQTAEATVDVYIDNISKEQANVDACVRLVDAECKFHCSVVYIQSYDL
jgi:hypothetical protein